MAVLSLLLCACSTAHESTPPAASTPPATAAAPAPDAAKRVPEDLLTQNGVYYGCKVDSDCAVKNIGNCCGYYPACVNKDAQTFPEQVKADCAKDGRMSICGFPNIVACECLEGRCTNVVGPDAAAPSEQ